MLSFRKTIENHKAGDILFPEGGAVIINELPFSKHQERGKGQVMVAALTEIDFE